MQFQPLTKTLMTTQLRLGLSFFISFALLFLLLHQFATIARTANGDFIDSGQTLGDSASYDVALDDLDGDGDLDAFVANFGTDTAGQPNIVWLNQGGAQEGTPGVFADNGQTLGNTHSYEVALGDLDGDTDVDAFVANFGGNTIWLNNGAGLFNDSGQSLGTYSTWDVALGDLDNDGDLDAVTANMGNNQPNKIWLNQGGVQGGAQGTFADSGQDLGNNLSGAVALGDLDGDGDLDIYQGITFSSPRNDQIWVNQGGDQGGTPGIFSNSGQSLALVDTSGVTLADLDNDSDLDAIAIDINFNQQPTVWLNQGGGQGGPQGTFIDSGHPHLGGAAQEIALGDLDGDNDLDAFVPVYRLGDPNRVWFNDGSGQFSDSGQELGNANSYGAALGDLDGDGDLDAFVANYGNGVVGEANAVWLNQSETPPPAEEANLVVAVSGERLKEFNPRTALTASLQYKIAFTNTGPHTATGVQVMAASDSPHFLNGKICESAACLCGGLTCGDETLAPGESRIWDLTMNFVELPKDEAFVGRMISEVSVSGNEVDPDESNNNIEFFTDLYACDQADLCFFENDLCDAIDDSSLTSQIHNVSGSVRRLVRAAQFLPDLPLYYRVRDEALTTPDGQHYTDLYYTHDPEIQTLVFNDAGLEAEGLAVLAVWEPNLQALVAGEGDSVTITAEQVNAMSSFLTNLSAAGSPTLQQVIDEELARLGPLNDYVGMTMAEAATAVGANAPSNIGTVYLPLVLK